MGEVSADNCVLVVEDDPQVASLVKMVLDDIGITNVLECDDGAAAIALFESRREEITAIISDWNLPGASGLELLKKVRMVDPGLPFILLTGRDSVESVVDAAGCGVSRYLYKPFAPDKLQRAILMVLKGPESATPAPTEPVEEEEVVPEVSSPRGT
ncbi:MAG: response regulator [Alphaproteobacteria bacterium]